MKLIKPIFRKKRKLFDRPILKRRHPLGDGIQMIYRFENGYGASIVRAKIGETYVTYTDNEKEWELGVIKFYGDDPDSFHLCYDTPITDDVIGHLTADEVEEILWKIKRLKNAPNAGKN